MKPFELFGVVVRTISFIVIIYGLWNVCGAVDNVVENIMEATRGGETDLPSTFPYFAFGLPALVFGTVCFFFANFIVKLTYRDSSP